MEKDVFVYVDLAGVPHLVGRLWARVRKKRAPPKNGTGEYQEFSKIFAVSDFGYREIRVERSLRLSFKVTPERLARLKLVWP